MGLEDFKSEDSGDIGEIKTRKKIENVTLDGQVWERVLYHQPSIAEVLIVGMSDNSVKAVVQLMDSIILNEANVEGWNEDQASEVEEYRNQIVKKHLDE